MPPPSAPRRLRRRRRRRSRGRRPAARRVTSPTKSAYPGVSRTLTLIPSKSKGASASETEIARLCSSGSKSQTVLPSSTRPILGIAPATKSSASVSVVLPAPAVADEGHVADLVRRDDVHDRRVTSTQRWGARDGSALYGVGYRSRRQAHRGPSTAEANRHPAEAKTPPLVYPRRTRERRKDASPHARRTLAHEG